MICILSSTNSYTRDDSILLQTHYRRITGFIVKLLYLVKMVQLEKGKISRMYLATIVTSVVNCKIRGDPLHN